MKKFRIGRLGFGTGRQKMAPERWTDPKRSRRTCRLVYGLQSWRDESAGVANGRVCHLPPEIPTSTVWIRNFCIAVRHRPAYEWFTVGGSTHPAYAPLVPRPDWPPLDGTRPSWCCVRTRSTAECRGWRGFQKVDYFGEWVSEWSRLATADGVSTYGRAGPRSTQLGVLALPLTRATPPPLTGGRVWCIASPASQCSKPVLPCPKGVNSMRRARPPPGVCG
jgi:hypothetical protein